MDFILLDILCLNVAFILAYMTRQGFHNPYGDWEYICLALVYTLADFVILVCNRTLKNVLKRGRYKEFAATVKHVLLVLVIITLYLFAMQSGDTYSRITVFVTVGFHLIIGS